MRSASRPRGILGAAAVLVVLALLGLPGVAVAAGTTTSDSAAARTLSVSGTVSAVAGSSQGSLDIDIPDGFAPVRLTGTVTPQDPGEGEADYYVNGVRVGSVATDRAKQIEIPLGAADVVDGVLRIGLRYTVPSVQTTTCPSTDLDLVTLSGIQVELSGAPQPVTSIGDFFASTVDAVSVIIPDDPSTEERQAGLIAVGAIAMRYPLPTQVTLTTESDAAHRPQLDAVFGRVVRISTTGTGATTTLVSDGTAAPELRIAGRADQLAGAATALGSQFLQLADATAVQGPSATLDPTPQLSVTLDDLGRSDIELHGYGRAETSIGIRQSQFGGPVSSLQIHLSGTHSAINDSIVASIQVYWNDQLVASTMLGSATAYDTTFDLSSAYLNASNTLTIQLNSVPQGGDCTSASSTIIPLDLSINGKASAITATRGQGLPTGFQRFPQTLANRLPVAFGTQGDAADLVAAAGSVVVALQRANVGQLVVTVPTLSDFLAGSTSGVLVGAAPQDAATLAAPLRYGEFRAIDQSNGEFAVGVSEPFAAAEAFSQGGRDVLMLGGYSPDSSTDAATSTLEFRVADQIANGQYGWDGLYNDLLILTSSAKQPVIFKSNGLAPSEAVVADYSEQAWWILAALAVAILVVVIVAVSLARRRRRVRRLVDEQQRADRERLGSDGDQH